MSSHALNEILNFLPLSERIGTAGQPTVEQFELIRAAGYEVVVNLALPSSSHAIAHEKTIVEALGMQYIPIPVIWENPTLEDLEAFFGVMNANAETPVFVHCAMNMRVSAFMYLYRRICQHIEDEIAKPDLNKIWTPNPVWSDFIQGAIHRYQP